jgi:hypothetical protein
LKGIHELRAAETLLGELAEHIREGGTTPLQLNQELLAFNAIVSVDIMQKAVKKLSDAGIINYERVGKARSNTYEHGPWWSSPEYGIAIAAAWDSIKDAAKRRQIEAADKGRPAAAGARRRPAKAVRSSAALDENPATAAGIEASDTASSVVTAGIEASDYASSGITSGIGESYTASSGTTSGDTAPCGIEVSDTAAGIEASDTASSVVTAGIEASDTASSGITSGIEASDTASSGVTSSDTASSVVTPCSGAVAENPCPDRDPEDEPKVIPPAAAPTAEIEEIELQPTVSITTLNPLTSYSREGLQSTTTTTVMVEPMRTDAVEPAWLQAAVELRKQRPNEPPAFLVNQLYVAGYRGMTGSAIKAALQEYDRKQTDVET